MGGGGGVVLYVGTELVSAVHVISFQVLIKYKFGLILLFLDVEIVLIMNAFL